LSTKRTEETLQEWKGCLSYREGYRRAQTLSSLQDLMKDLPSRERRGHLQETVSTLPSKRGKKDLPASRCNRICERDKDERIIIDLLNDL
jgi:hypothetical protein